MMDRFIIPNVPLDIYIRVWYTQQVSSLWGSRTHAHHDLDNDLILNHSVIHTTYIHSQLLRNSNWHNIEQFLQDTMLWHWLAPRLFSVMSLYNAAVWTQSIVCSKYYLHRQVTVQLTVDMAAWQMTTF